MRIRLIPHELVSEQEFKVGGPSHALTIHLLISVVTASVGFIMLSPPSYFLEQTTYHATLALVG
jgi:hypothetical protein